MEGVVGTMFAVLLWGRSETRSVLKNHLGQPQYVNDSW